MMKKGAPRVFSKRPLLRSFIRKEEKKENVIRFTEEENKDNVIRFTEYTGPPRYNTYGIQVTCHCCCYFFRMLILNFNCTMFH